MEDGDDWTAVADAINDRMLHLQLTQQALSDRSGVSLSTLRELQHGQQSRRRSPRTLAAIATALEWEPDYLHRVARGEAAPTRDRARQEAVDKLRAEIDDLRQQVGVLQTQLIDLYSRVGQPYPGHQVDTDGTRRRSADRRA